METKEILKYWNRFTSNFKDAAYCIRTDRTDWNIDDFLKSGEEDYNKYFSFPEIEGKQNKTILDIGCGIGRLLFPVRKHWGTLIGIDVSDGMIDIANDLKCSICKKNEDFIKLKFMVCDGSGKIPIDHADCIISIICFQHIPTAEAQLNYFREIGRILSPGGIAKIMVQHKKYNRGDGDCSIGAGLDIGEIISVLPGLDISEVNDRWICQESRNRFVVVKK
jgi:SAM-dependent methyltransferase